MRSFIQNKVIRNATFISQKEYGNVRIEYGDIVKEYIIPKYTDAKFYDVGKNIPLK